MKEGREQILMSEAGLVRLRENLKKLEAELVILRKEKNVAYTASGDTWHDNPTFNKLDQDERRKTEDIAILKTHIANARLYRIEKRNTENIRIGSIARLAVVNEKTGEKKEMTLEVVGYGETAVEKNQIAYNAPLGKVLLGLTKGDVITFNAPSGKITYTVLALYSEKK